MLKQRTPMRRSGFASQWKPRPPAEERPERPILRLARVPKPSEPVFAPQPKATYVRDEDYRRAVASLPCARCGVVGRKRKVVRKELRSTTRLSVKRMSEYLDKVMAFAVTDLGVVFSETKWERYRGE